jgi:8-oxo-dGTP pyrophosphatase MutT (NUDIX family)
VATWDQIAEALASRQGTALSESLTRAAVAIVLRDGPSGIEMLFIRRAEHPDDPWSGHMAYPGGRAEPQDQDLRDTAIRETREEIGIDLTTSASFLGALDELRAMARMRPLDLSITPYVFRLEGTPEIVLSDEVTSVHWIPLNVLFAPTSLSIMDYQHQGARLQFPCFRVDAVVTLADEVVIWGLTFRMCTSFREFIGHKSDMAPRSQGDREQVGTPGFTPGVPEGHE